MTKKLWMLIAFAALLGAASLYLNRDWFGGQDIQIFHRSRPGRSRGRVAPTDATEPLFFGFSRPVRLTSLEVVAVDDLATNRLPRVYWHLVSDSNSVPVKDFTYGAPIRGMHPQIKGASAEPLAAGVQYRLCAQTGSRRLEHDFTPVASRP